MPTPSLLRRRLLALGGGAVAAVLPGCTALPFVENPVDMTILNRHTEKRGVGVKAIRRNGDREYSEAVELSEYYYLPARKNGTVRKVREENVLPSAAYVLRVDLERQAPGGDRTFDFHFFPDCTGGTDEDGRDRPQDEFLLEVQPDGDGVTFKQNNCSGDSWKL